CVEIFAGEDPRAEMIVKDFALIDHFRSVIPDSEQGASAAVTGNENLVVVDQRIRIVGVIAGFPRKAPEFLGGSRVYGDEVFRGEDQDAFFAFSSEEGRTGVTRGTGAVEPDQPARIAIQRCSCGARV